LPTQCHSFAIPDGLLRKNFVLSEDGRSAGGVYLWQSRAMANRFYQNCFRDLIAKEFSTTPSITCFDTPLVLDNTTGELLKS
jgi:hypothetical protein